MIITKKEKIKQIETWKKEQIHILIDFDRTLTTYQSKSSWGFLDNTQNIPKEYFEERDKLFEFYRPIELDTTMNEHTKSHHMEKWWLETIKLFTKYKISKQLLNRETKKPDFMEFRKGAKEFLKTMHKNNIPVIIMSAGISNFIEEFLKNNNCKYDNTYIIANKLTFKDDIVHGISGPIIHSSNKQEINLSKEIINKIKERPKTILIGDTITDANMTKNKKEDTLKIGFLDEKIDENLENYKQAFDVVCTNNTSYNELTNEIKILKD